MFNNNIPWVVFYIINYVLRIKLVCNDFNLRSLEPLYYANLVLATYPDTYLFELYFDKLELNTYVLSVIN